MTVGLRGKATATDGVSSTRCVASAAKASGAYQIVPQFDRHHRVEAGSFGGRAAGTGVRASRSVAVMVKTRMGQPRARRRSTNGSRSWPQKISSPMT